MSECALALERLPLVHKEHWIWGRPSGLAIPAQLGISPSVYGLLIFIAENEYSVSWMEKALIIGPTLLKKSVVTSSLHHVMKLYSVVLWHDGFSNAWSSNLYKMRLLRVPCNKWERSAMTQ